MQKKCVYPYEAFHHKNGYYKLLAIVKEEDSYSSLEVETPDTTDRNEIIKEFNLKTEKVLKKFKNYVMFFLGTFSLNLLKRLLQPML